MDHVLLGFGEIAQAAAAGHDHLQLLGRVCAAVAATFQAQGAGDDVGGAFDHHHEGER